jgi:hypothetical protein
VNSINAMFEKTTMLLLLPLPAKLIFVSLERDSEALAQSVSPRLQEV